MEKHETILCCLLLLSIVAFCISLAAVALGEGTIAHAIILFVSFVTLLALLIWVNKKGGKTA